ncbi:acetyl-CoA hydrolase/transferase family protein [bacterium]|nr:acetyl-CoA hydrolase/transferase family protein [bacterium]
MVLTQPKEIKLIDLPEVIAQRFAHQNTVTVYVGSNAAAPTACFEVLTEAIENRQPRLPFIRMVHLLLQGPVPYVKPGLQDRIMVYSVFSAGDVRKAANEGRAFYVPCTLANLDVLIDKGCPYEPDIALFKVTRHPKTGELSMGLSVESMHTAIDHADIAIAELDPSMPFTHGQSIVDASSIDYLIVDDAVKPVHEIEPPDFDNLSPEERRIGELITKHFIRNGVTIQVGIGKIPDAVIATIRNGNFKNLGIQTELYGDGLMILQQEEIVTNRMKKTNKGYSTTSLIMGSKELYDFVHLRSGIQMRPCSFTNSAETIRQNAPFISVNTSVGVDLYGNVWADFIDATRYYSGVGGQPDFIRALNKPSYGVPIIAIRSVTNKNESKIVPTHPPGVSLTASAYDPVVIVNEYGIADLRGLTAGEKALAIASIAHPDFRETYLKTIANSPFFTKPVGFKLGQTPRNVILYDGDIRLERE